MTKRFASNSSAAFALPSVGGRVVQVDVLAEVVEPVAEQMHDTTLGDLSLQPGEELVPRRRRLTEPPATRQAAAA